MVDEVNEMLQTSNANNFLRTPTRGVKIRKDDIAAQREQRIVNVVFCARGAGDVEMEGGHV